MVTVAGQVPIADAPLPAAKLTVMVFAVIVGVPTIVPAVLGMETTEPLWKPEPEMVRVVVAPVLMGDGLTEVTFIAEVVMVIVP